MNEGSDYTKVMRYFDEGIIYRYFTLEEACVCGLQLMMIMR